MFCDLLFGILGSLILIAILYYKRDMFKELDKTLSKEQVEKIDGIKTERLIIAVVSIVLSIIATFFTSYIIPQKTTCSKFCIYPLLFLIYTIILYEICPKGDYILLHLKGEKQLQAYIDITENIKLILLIGFLVGIIIYFFLDKLISKIGTVKNLITGKK